MTEVLKCHQCKKICSGYYCMKCYKQLKIEKHKLIIKRLSDLARNWRSDLKCEHTGCQERSVKYDLKLDRWSCQKHRSD